MLEMLDVAIGFSAVMLAVSLIIMSLTQAAASLLALRGAKLRRGLEDLITYTVPDLAGNAKDLAARIVKHPLISDSATTLGGRWKLASAIKKEELLPVLDAVLKESGTRANGIEDLGEKAQQRLTAWFDSFMARVSQWFVMNTRWITIGLTVAFALYSHFDSLGVLRQIQNDSETRARLSSMASTLLDQTPEAVRGVEAIYLEALRELVTGSPSQLKAGATPGDGDAPNRDKAHTWIRQNVGEKSDPAPLIAQLNAAVNNKLTLALDKSIDRAKTLEGNLVTAGISIRPEKGHDFKELVKGGASHLAGIAISILFLSLGAPFWFNLLKNMTSLRSTVAQKATGASDAAAGGSGGAEVTRAASLTGDGAPEVSLPGLPARPTPVTRADQGGQEPVR